MKESDLSSPFKKSDNKVLHLLSTSMSETRAMKQIASIKRREQLKKENELAMRLKFSKNSRCQGGFYLIKTGHCVVVNHDDQYRSKVLKQGDFFGESDLL